MGIIYAVARQPHKCVARALTLEFDGTDSFLASIVPQVGSSCQTVGSTVGDFLFLILQIRPFQIRSR